MTQQCSVKMNRIHFSAQLVVRATVGYTCSPLGLPGSHRPHVGDPWSNTTPSPPHKIIYNHHSPTIATIVF